MKISFKEGLFLLGTVLCLTGCLAKQYAEPNANLSISSDVLTVPSDDPAGIDSVKDTIWVEANRNWSAKLLEEVDWVTMKTNGHVDLSRSSEWAPLPLSFKDNESKADRSANIRIFYEGGTKDFKVVQKGVVYRLSLISDLASFINLDAAEGNYILSISTNSEWSVKMKDGSTVNVTFPTSSGKNNANIEMHVAENEDMAEKTGTIVISANECEDIEVPISQVKGSPYVKFVDGPVYTAEDGIQDYTIPFKTNSDWTAEIDAVSGYPDGSVTLSKTSGDANDTKLEVLFPGSIDFSIKKASISVKFTAKGAEPVFATIEQTPAIRLAFGDPFGPDIHTRDAELFPKTASTNPEKYNTFLKYFPFSKLERLNPDTDVWEDYTSQMFNSNRKTAALCNAHLRYTLKNGGFYLGVYSTDTAATPARAVTIQYNLGLSVSNVKTAYIQLPAVPGKKLSRVRYWQHSSGCEINIADANGVTMMKSVIKLAKTDEPAYKDVKVDGAGIGEAMKFTNENGGWWVNIADLILYYE